MNDDEAVKEEQEPAMTDAEISPEATQDAIRQEDDAEAPATAAETEQAVTEEQKKKSDKPYHERYYLLYSDDDRTGWLDTGGARNFLNGIGFDGGELKQARHLKDVNGTLETQDDSDGAKFYCSYCGREISGVDFYRLPDGRMRCTSCSRTLVKTKEELITIYDCVLANLDVFFGATFGTPINIEMLEERNLKRKIHHPLATIDDQSILILGVAVNKNKKYNIYLENGVPRISLIATFAHELTHIWQYENWDNVKGFPKCPKKFRLLIYEGMAKWVEIQYLYLIGETMIARREENYTLGREDEYGIGFRLYLDKYPLCRDAMECDSAPFTKNGYPIS